MENGSNFPYHTRDLENLGVLNSGLQFFYLNIDEGKKPEKKDDKLDSKKF